MFVQCNEIQCEQLFRSVSRFFNPDETRKVVNFDSCHRAYRKFQNMLVKIDDQSYTVSEIMQTSHDGQQGPLSEFFIKESAIPMSSGSKRPSTFDETRPFKLAHKKERSEGQGCRRVPDYLREMAGIGNLYMITREVTLSLLQYIDDPRMFRTCLASFLAGESLEFRDKFWLSFPFENEGVTQSLEALFILKSGKHHTSLVVCTQWSEVSPVDRHKVFQERLIVSIGELCTISTPTRQRCVVISRYSKESVAPGLSQEQIKKAFAELFDKSLGEIVINFSHGEHPTIPLQPQVKSMMESKICCF